MVEIIIFLLSNNIIHDESLIILIFNILIYPNLVCQKMDKLILVLLNIPHKPEIITVEKIKSFFIVEKVKYLF